MDRIPSYVHVQGQMNRKLIYLELLPKQHLSWNPKPQLSDSQLEHSVLSSVCFTVYFQIFSFCCCCLESIGRNRESSSRTFFPNPFQYPRTRQCFRKKICGKCCTLFLGRKTCDKYLAFGQPKFMNLNVTICMIFI